MSIVKFIVGNTVEFVNVTINMTMNMTMNPIKTATKLQKIERRKKSWRLPRIEPETS